MPVNNLVNLMYEVVGWGKQIAPAGAAIALIVGGLQFIFNGKNGFEKAKPWLLGAFIGLIVTLGATSISEFLKNKITF